VDSFVDYHSVGHEPADVQVAGILSTLVNNGINPANMICLSRDNPRVMQKVFRDLEESVKASNNPKLIDAPCYLHPTHTAFKTGAKALDKDIVSLLGNLHGYFKTSTARRADMMEVREELAEQLQDEYEEVLEEFFLRHVDTRWLEAQRCLERLLGHFDSTVEYFVEYLPNSPLQNNKSAVKSKKYKKIAKHLCKEEVIKTKIRCKFLILLASSTKTFLTLLQSQRPMIHQLQGLAFDMFVRLGSLIIRPTALPARAKNVKKIDLSDAAVLLHSKDCGFNACCAEEMVSLLAEERKEVRLELKRALTDMLKYLQANLPWDKVFYEQISFFDPVKRTEQTMVANGMAIADYMNRFTEEGKLRLASQLSQYQALPLARVPSFTRQDRVDRWWVEVLRGIAEVNDEHPKELDRLIKLCCTLAHGNAFLERGMGLTKRVVTGRNSLAHTSVKAQKVVKQAIDLCGGVLKVPITSNMITCVRGASRCYNEELEKEKKAVEKNKKDAEEGIEAAKKRKAEEDSKKVWQGKKDDLETEIKSSKEFIGKQEMLRKDATDKALKMTNTANMKSSMMTAKFAAEAADERGKILNSKQAELALHMGKKPRGPGGGAK
jgi:hypothetical protein